MSKHSVHTHDIHILHMQGPELWEIGWFAKRVLHAIGKDIIACGADGTPACLVTCGRACTQLITIGLRPQLCELAHFTSCARGPTSLLELLKKVLVEVECAVVDCVIAFLDIVLHGGHRVCLRLCVTIAFLYDAAAPSKLILCYKCVIQPPHYTQEPSPCLLH